ncbi:MAG TPA: AsmA-like C-terminal region-containing protein [Candidatus Ozemobacteraceae bacterium]|nr:AsmA-like C-terminal region-containing protein [Candidatus Ozemobacteraceae bacterium]
MNEDEVKPARPARGLFFYFKVLLVTCVLLAVTAGIAIFYVYHRLTTDSQLEKMVMEKVSQAISMDVQFEKLAVVFPGLEINNVRVATDSADLKLDAHIDRIKIRPDLWAAFAGELAIESLSIASSSTFLELKAGKKVSTDDSGSRKSALDLSSVKFPFHAIDFTDLRFSVKDGNSGQTHEVQLNSAALSRSLLSTSIPFNVDAVLIGKARASVEGKLYWPSNVVADVNVQTENIEELKKIVPDSFKKHAQGFKSAEIKAHLKYQLAEGAIDVESCSLKIDPGLSAEAKCSFSSISPAAGSASIKLSPVPVDQFWPVVKGFVPAEHGLTLSGGHLSASVDLVIADGRVSDLSVSAKPDQIEMSLKALPEKVHIGRGQLAYKEGKLSLSGFEAKMSDNLVKMPTGNVSMDPVAFNGELEAEINLDKIWKLVSTHLSEESRRIVPGGKAAFKGKISYDAKKSIRVDGTLDSEQIKVSEKKTSAAATIERLRVHFDSIGPSSGQIKIESLEIKGVGAVVNVNGAIKNAADMGFDLSAKGDLSVEEFSRLGAVLFNVPVKEGQFKGDLSLDMKVGGTLANIKPSGRLEFKNLAADLSNRGFKINNLNGAASADLDKLVLDKLSADLLGGKLSIGGSLKDFKKPVVDAKASITGADLSAIRSFLQTNFQEMSKEIDFSGNADLNIQLTGPVSGPVIKGEAELRASRFNHPAVLRPIENIHGPLKFDNDGLNTAGLKADWGKSKATVTGAMKNWARFITDFKFVVDPLDVTDVAGFFLKDTGYKVEGSGTGNGSITGAVAEIKVDGVASVPVGLFAAPVSEKGDLFKFPFKALQARAVYHAGVLTVSSATMELFSGKVNASGKVFVDKEPITFEFDTKINQLMTEQFLAENTKYKDILRGGLDGTFAAKGNTTGLVSLNGNASLAMQKGHYNSPPFVRQIADQLNAPQLASGPIDNAAGEYLISGGRINAKNMMGKSKDGKVTFLGSVGLDATLDGEAQIQLTRAACQQSNVLKQLVGNSEYLDIPVTLKGSFMSPSVGLPLDRMLKDVAEKRAKETVQKEAEKALGKLFGIKGGGSNPAPVASAAVETPAGSPAPEAASQTVQPVPQEPQSPQKKIEKKIKDVGKELKNLKNIFKF